VLDASTSYTDNNVNAGATYYYVVTAVNADDQESGPSNEVKVKIPSP
jgi:fibronectin type 3 domain-containing protein